MNKWIIFCYLYRNKNHNHDVIKQLLFGGTFFDVGAREAINGIQALSFSEIIIQSCCSFYKSWS